ncbi:T9SS type A sorting domain-containing protein [Tamlana crocina]
MKRLLLFFLLCTTFVGAQNWITSSTQQADLINEISVVNDDVIWLMDQQGTPNGFSISTDGGQSWTHKNFPALFSENNFNLGVLSAVDANTAYVIVSLADDANLVGVYKTTDAGTTWLREPTIFNGGASFPNQVHFWSADQGFAMGDGLELYVYYFGAWYNQSSGLNSVGTWSLNSSNYLKIVGNSAYFLTGAGTIIKTADQGITWVEIATPFNSQSNVNFSFKDNMNGIVVFNDNTSNQLYATTDGGQTWNLVGNNIQNLNHIIEYEPSEKRYYSISRDLNNLTLSYSEDNGVTWTVEPQFNGILLGELETSREGKIFIGGTSTVYSKTPDFSNHPDLDALVALYNSLNGDQWTDSTNWLDTTKAISSWYGITETNGRVTGIDLGYQNNVSGSIPSEIGDLTELETFWIQASSITGEIPSSIGNLTKLRQLVLYYTYGIIGSIPASIQNCTNLEWIYLSGNELEGTIPDLSGLNSLTNFVIDNNNFQFGDFENEFASYQNNISQFIYSPQKYVGEDVNSVLEIGQTETLNASLVSGGQNSYNWYRMNADGSDGGFVSAGMSVDVTINNTDDYKWYYFYEINSSLVPGLILRSGFFHFAEPPTSSPDYNALVALYNSTNGENWTNNTNWLDTTKPLNTWHGIYNVVNNRVVDLNIGNNNLTGSIPPEIGNLTELTYLSLWGNELTGNIPPEIGNLTKLTYLDLAPNNFSGSIPTEIGNLVNLETLWLNQSGLSGSIPASLVNLTKLKHLHLHSSIGPGWGDNTSAYSGDFPDLTALPLELLHIYNNYFEFSDVADELETYKANIPDFQFSPQFTQDLPEDTNIGVGSDITLTVTDVPIASKGMKTKTVVAQNTYQWFKDNVAITENGNSDTYVINNAQTSDSGIYHCEITNTDTPDFVIRRAFITLNVGTLGTEEQQLEQLRIYPNPTTSVLNIKLKGQNNAYVAIFDMSGKEVFKKQIATQWGVFNIESLNTGVYMLQVKTNGKTIKKRMVKK